MQVSYFYFVNQNIQCMYILLSYHCFFSYSVHSCLFPIFFFYSTMGCFISTRVNYYFPVVSQIPLRQERYYFIIKKSSGYVYKAIIKTAKISYCFFGRRRRCCYWCCYCCCYCCCCCCWWWWWWWWWWGGGGGGVVVVVFSLLLLLFLSKVQAMSYLFC